MAHLLVMTERQKERKIQAEKDLDLEKEIVDWIDKVLHKRPPVEDEENYTKFIKYAKYVIFKAFVKRDITEGWLKQKVIWLEQDL